MDILSTIIPKVSAEKTFYGYLVEFDDTESVLAAAEKVRGAGYKKWDVHTPFPVHGMDEAMGIRPTILPWIVLGAGLTGLAAGLGMQWWMNGVNYPINISGKPLFGLPAAVPITFELTILFSALAAVGGMFVLNLLPEWYHPVFASKTFKRVTTDRFFIAVEAIDPIFDKQKTLAFLNTLNGLSIESIED